MSFDAGDRRQVKDKKLENKAQRKQELDDLRWLLTAPQGLRLARRILETTGVFQSSFTGNSETFFREGQRNVGLWLFREIEAAGSDLLGKVILSSTKEQ